MGIHLKSGFFRTLYRLFGGLNCSMSLGIAMLSYYSKYGESILVLKQGFYILPCFMLVSASLCFACIRELNKLIDPFLYRMDERSIRTFCLYPFIFFLLILLFYINYLQMPGMLTLLSGGILCILGTCFIYYLNSRTEKTRIDSIQAARRSALLERVIQQQQQQYLVLSDRIEKARNTQHDLRFHFREIERLALFDDREALLSYINSLQKSSIITGLHGICDNVTVDAVAGYYLELAKKAGTELDVSINIHKTIPFPTDDLCVIWGNCMENAVDALSAVPSGQKLLRIRAEQTEHTLTIMVGNSYCGKLLPSGKLYLSTKHSDSGGIGLSSISAVVERHGGSLSIDTKDGFFLVSILLFLDENADSKEETDK